MEDAGTGVMELLVARAVQVCCQVCCRMQHMQPDKDLPYTEGGEADPQQGPVTISSPGDGKALKGWQTWAQPLGWPLSHWVCWVVSKVVQGYHSQYSS